MIEHNNTRHVEAIIGAASPEEAKRYASRRKKLVSSQDFMMAVTALMQAELNVNPASRRFYALARLGEYVSAAFRGDPLPELLVTTTGSTEELENEDLRPDSADQWMNYIQKQKPAAATPEFKGETGEFMRHHNLQRSIQDRLLAMPMKLKDGNVGPDDIKTMKEVIRDCDHLIGEGPSRYFKPEDYKLDRKKIEAVKYMARIEEKRARFAAAKSLYDKAAKQYREAGEEYEAVSCLLDIAWLEFTEENERQAALDRVLEIRGELSSGTLESTEVNVVLGEFYSAFKDDHEAQKYLNEALKELDGSRDLKNPSGAEFAQAFQSLLLSVGGGTPSQEDPNAFLRQNAARGLYRRIYRAFESIYRRQGDVTTAVAYQQKLNEMDGTMREGNKFNLDFSNEMSKNLGDLLKKMGLG